MLTCYGKSPRQKGQRVENSSNLHRTKQRSQLEKKGNRLGNNVLTTNNTNIKDTIRETPALASQEAAGATPSPLPACGQAKALLAEGEAAGWVIIRC